MFKVISKDTTGMGLLVLALMVAVMLMPDAAWATSPSMDSILCKAVGFVTGGVGKALATLAILILGIGAFFGKVTWGLAVLVAIGIGGVFGAVSIVNIVSGSGACTA